MTKLLLVLVAICTILGTTMAQETPKKNATSSLIKGKIRPQRLNVRIQPVANAGVVDKLARASEVEIVAVEGAWYKIVLPKTASCYVSADYVRNGKTITRVQMRYGAGIAYTSYGIIAGDTAVKVLNDSNPQWTKIEPPAGFYAYVSSEFVAVADSDYEKLTGVAGAVPPSARTVELPKVNPAKMSEMAKRFEVMRPFVSGTPSDITLTGEVQITDNASTGAAHVLIKRENGKVIPLAVLYHGKVQWENWSNPDQSIALPEAAVDLSKFVGKRVKLTGKRLDIVNWSDPYVVVESVEAL